MPANPGDELTLDVWTPLSHKRILGGANVPGTSFLAPTWVGKQHERRMLAYKLLQSYLDNAARHYLATDDANVKLAHREYGDAALLRDSAMALMLGDDFEILAVESDDEDEGIANAAAERVEYLQGWATAERFRRRVIENERNVIGLGDGVYVLGWSNRRARARLKVYPPEAYFPVIDDEEEDEYPRKIHLAWEVERLDQTDKNYIRRITWELVEAASPYRVGYQDELCTDICLLTDCTFEWDSQDERTIDDLSPTRAEYRRNEDGVELKQFPIGLDFIPVVHVPNTVAGAEHFGRSTIMSVAQVLDDVSAVDTDLARAAAKVGIPPIALSGSTSKGTLVSYGPGQVFNLGPDGKMTVLDLAAGLESLSKFADKLQDRLSTNARLSAEVLGKVRASEVPSGFAFALAFGPTRALIEEMRLVRDEKYRLLLKFVQRLAIIGRAIDGPVYDAYVGFGQYLPSDESQAIEAATRLVGEGRAAASRQTAVQLLVNAGLPIDDVGEELERIEQEDFTGATQLLDATGNEQAVSEYLGVDVTREEPPPELDGAPVNAPPADVDLDVVPDDVVPL